MNIIEPKKSQITLFCHRNNVSLFIIFGSHAKGATPLRSDIDIALAVEDQNAEVDKLQLIYELDDIFDRQLDLVILTSSTDPLLQFEIFSAGILVFESRPFLFEEKKLLAWKLYLDTQKIREMRNQRFKKYIRKLENDYRRVQ